MKNNPVHQAYISTSQAAHMLGLSVGTIQRMVENGIFKAFVTQGGHRRILTSSLSQYCKQQGCETLTAAPDKPLICVLHDSQHLLPTLAPMGQWKQVKFINHPLDLLGIHETVGAFFIDARIPWLHTTPLDLHDNLMEDAHIVVYNSGHLPPSSPLHLAKKLTLLEGDISTAMVCGYLLGSASASAAEPGTPRPVAQ